MENFLKKTAVPNGPQTVDNEKLVTTYQLEMLKDEYIELEESLILCQKESREKNRALDLLNRDFKKQQDENRMYKEALDKYEKLISPDVIELVETFEGASFSEKLANLVEERDEFVKEIRQLKADLDEERARSEERLFEKEQSEARQRSVSLAGDTESNSIEDSDTKKLLHDYKFKLKKTEQENVLLTGNVTRLETQVARYKTALEEAEKQEDELKTEKRKILRDLRECQARVEELETANTHLQKRIDKLKETRIATIINS